jgi:hypothetical protein
MRILFPIALLVAALFVAPDGVRAQTVGGTIQGTVTDSSGGVLPGVTVTVRHVDTGQERVVVTNLTGFYTAPFVPIGRYRVIAILSGFGTIIRENIDLGLNQTQVADFRLDPRMTSEVTVTAESPAINTTNAEVKGSLTAEQILEKPTLNPGGFLSLHGLSGESDQRSKQSDRFVRVIDQFQRHRHARRDVSDQRREQRRLIGKPAPSGCGDRDHPRISDSEKQLFGRIRPGRWGGGAGSDEGGQQSRSR